MDYMVANLGQLKLLTDSTKFISQLIHAHLRVAVHQVVWYRIT